MLSARRNIRFALILLCFSWSCLIQAQSVWQDDDYDEAAPNSIADLFDQAKSAYETGDFSKCLEVLDVIDWSDRPKGFKSEDLYIDWMLLYATVYLRQHRETKALEYYKKVLEAKPMFELDPVKSGFDLYYLSKKLHARTRFLFGYQAGINGTFPELKRRFSISDPNLSDESYTLRIGYQAGIHFQWQFLRNLELGLAGNYRVLNYAYEESLRNPDPANTNEIYDLGKLSFRERQAAWSIPLYLRFNYVPFKNSSRRFTLFANAGLGFQHLSKAELLGLEKSFQQTSLLQRESRINLIPGGEENLRSQNNYFWMAGVGLKLMPIVFERRLYVFAEWRYQRLLRNMVNTSNRYQNDQLVFDFNYLDNDVRIHWGAFQLGISFPFYKIVER